MDIIERYLASVRRNLPKDRAEDIAAELADALENRRDEKEAALGRPLTEEETGTLLKDFGHPLVIAGRYRPHQFLIGPAVYPFYLAVMKVVLAAGATLLVGFAAISFLLSGNHLLPALTRTIGDLSFFFVFAVAGVTILFALLERRGFPADHLADWRPEQLPEAFEKPESQWNSAVEVGLGIAFLLWWTGIVTVPPIARGGEFIAPGPVWEDYYLPILLLAAAQLVANLIKWARPHWRRLNSLLAALLSVATLGIVVGLYRAGSWVTARPGAADPLAAGQLAASVDLALRIAFVVVAVVTLLRLLGELWKLARPQPRPHG